MEQQHKPPVRAVMMPLFPTADSLKSAVELAESRLPITNSNELFSLLMLYHNTLLKQQLVDLSARDFERGQREGNPLNLF